MCKIVGVTTDETNVQQSTEEDYTKGCFKENYLVPHVCPVATGDWCKDYTKCKSLEENQIGNFKLHNNSRCL